MNPGNSIQGQLERDGCRDLDVFSASEDENRVARFRFEISQTVLAKLSATSTEFDTYLALLGSDGKVVAVNDNADRSTSNSALSVSLGPGTYTAVVGGNRAGMGTFEVALGTERTKTCELAELAMPGTTNGSLNASQCRYLDVVTPSTATYAASIYKFTVAAATFVTISATGTGYAPIIDIQTPAGELMVYNLDSDGKVAASGVEMLKLQTKAGTYRIVVTTTFTGGGDYNLSVAGTVLPVQ